mmetsp:Transcript_1024/g.2235  ORF Transcript_1024/g.2235 Transcript_1024/m.2235 type:complete len:179 (-) Transcript_1024:1258-1794(-)
MEFASPPGLERQGKDMAGETGEFVCEDAQRASCEKVLQRCVGWGWIKNWSWEGPVGANKCVWVANPGHVSQVLWIIGTLDPRLVGKPAPEKVNTIKPDPAMVQALAVGFDKNRTGIKSYWKRRIDKLDQLKAVVPGVNRSLFAEPAPEEGAPGEGPSCETFEVTWERNQRHRNTSSDA